MAVIKNYTMRCDTCGFTTHDQALMENHSCEVTENGGRCEDYPCCGHEAGDCNGLLYGSDEAIKSDPHILCDHENGICEIEWEDGDALDSDYDEDDEEPEGIAVYSAQSPDPIKIYPEEKNFIEHNDYGY